MVSEKSGLVSTLEGFGLSEYEARAYVSLVEQESLMISELAYYSGIPRTKSYSTIRNLQRKGLVTLISGKPLRCRVVPPEDCLEGLLYSEENRLKKMRKAVQGLLRLRDESRKRVMMQENHYFTLSPQAVSAKLPELLTSCRTSFQCVVDNWGLRLLEECGDSVLTALANGVDVKIMASCDLEMTTNVKRLPGSAKLRLVRYLRGQNVFVFDEEQLMVVNSIQGSGMIISSTELASILRHALFDRLWRNSIAFKSATPLAPLSGGEDVLELLDKEKLNQLFVKAVCNATEDERDLARIGKKFLTELERSMHLDLFHGSFEGALPVLLSLVLESLGDQGAVRFDSVTRLLTIEAENAAEGVPTSVWLFAIAALLEREKDELKIVQKRNLSSESQILQLKISPSQTENH